MNKNAAIDHANTVQPEEMQDARQWLAGMLEALTAASSRYQRKNGHQGPCHVPYGAVCPPTNAR